MKIAELIVQLGADSSDMVKGLKKAKTEVEVFQESLKGISNMMVGIGGMSVAAVGGAIAATKSWAEAVNDLEDKTNMSAESCSELLYVTQAVGLSMSDAGDSLSKMSKNSVTAYQSIVKANEAGEQSTDIFTKYGITITDANGKLLSAQDILANVAKRHREMANGVAKTSMEMEIFGRGGARLNDLLNLTQEQLNGMTQRARAAGLVLDHETTQAWEDMTFQINEAKAAMIGVGVQVGKLLLPELQKLANYAQEVAGKIGDMTDEEKQTMITAMETAAAIGGLGLGIRALIFTFGPLITGIRDVIAALNAMRSAAIAAKIAAAGAIALGAAAIAYGAYSKYEAWKEGGVDALEYDPEGIDSVTVNKEKLDEIRKRKAEEEAQRASEEAEARAREAEERARAEAEAASATPEINLPSGGGGGKHGGASKAEVEARKAKAEAERLQREIEQITDDIKRATEASGELADNFTNAGRQLSVGMLDGAQAVYSQIEEERIRREQSLDDFLKQYRKSVEEAVKIKTDAEKTGDAAILEEAERYLLERQEAEAAAAEEVAKRRTLIEEDANKTMLANSTRARAIEAEMRAAMDEGDMQRYQAALSDENVAFMASLEERQAALQQYHDWRMAAEESYSAFSLQIMEQFRQNFSKSITDFIMGTKSLGDALGGVIKQMIQMYIQWRIQQVLAAAFAKKQQAQETATGTAQAATLAAAWWAAAIPKMIVTGGFGGFGGLGGTGTGIPFAGGSFTGFGVASPFRAMAEGGYAYGPTLALIGEGKHPEAVLPLNDNTFGEIAKGIAGQGIGGNVTLQVSAMDAGSFSHWLQTGGGVELKRYLADSAREFSMGGGAFA
ncbi:MAG: phage tail tape measure protein [Selenomonas noxia]